MLVHVLSDIRHQALLRVKRPTLKSMTSLIAVAAHTVPFKTRTPVNNTNIPFHPTSKKKKLHSIWRTSIQ